MHVTGRGLLYELINEEKAETNLDHGEKDKFTLTWQPIEKIADMLDDKIHETRHRGTQRDDYPGKIHFGDEVAVVHQAVAALRGSVGEELPGNQPGKHQ